MRRSFASDVIGRATLAAAVAVASGSVAGAGFQLNESSASGLGNAFAGGAALAADASVLWTNPAGLTRLNQSQLVGVFHLVTPSIKFGNAASASAAGQPLGDNGGDAGGVNFVPNLYYSMPLGSSVSAGIGITAPWGLVTEYSDTFIGRFQATKSKIQTINVNPSIAWRADRSLSVGFGLNFQRIEAEFNNLVNYSGALLSAAGANGIAPGSATFNAIAQATPGLTSRASVKGSDNAYGWNVGVLWDASPQIRLGAHYRSRISYKVSGDVHFTNPALPAIASPVLAATANVLANGVNAAALYDSGVRAEVKLPAIFNLSMVSAVDSRWEVMADLQWTEWSTIQNLRFVRADGRLLQDTPERFRDSWKVALGFTHRPGGALLWRGGLAWDQSPVRDSDRTPRLPDSDRVWLSGGGQYTIDSRLRLDFGVAYIRSGSASIDKIGDPASVAANGRLNGSYRSRTLVASGQLSYAF